MKLVYPVFYSEISLRLQTSSSLLTNIAMMRILNLFKSGGIYLSRINLLMISVLVYFFVIFFLYDVPEKTF
jgi:hypothetical protein